MLIAETDTWIGVAGIITGAIGLLTCLGTGIAWFAKSRREIRADAITEYLAVIARLDHDIAARDERYTVDMKAKNERIDRLEKRTDMQDDQIRVLQKSDADCRQREADLKADVVRSQRRIETLEHASMVLPIPVSVPLPGVIVANRAGIIQEFQSSLTVFLGWTSEEMKGQSIEKLMPPDELAKHRPAFAKASSPGGTIDPTKSVETYALDKSGQRVPIAITLKGWDAPGGLITATIQLRGRSLNR